MRPGPGSGGRGNAWRTGRKASASSTSRRTSSVPRCGSPTTGGRAASRVGGRNPSLSVLATKNPALERDRALFTFASIDQRPHLVGHEPDRQWAPAPIGALSISARAGLCLAGADSAGQPPRRGLASQHSPRRPGTITPTRPWWGSSRGAPGAAANRASRGSSGRRRSGRAAHRWGGL